MLPLITSFFANYGEMLRPVFVLLAWLLSGLMISTVIHAIVDVVKRSQTMHSIPCHSCRYCTRSYYLKCTVHPSIAFSESAINCLDFNPDDDRSYTSDVN